MTPGGDDLSDYCRRIYPRLVGLLGFHGLAAEAAEDVAQDALVRVVQHWAKVRTMASPEAWTFRVALNLATSRWRRGDAERRATGRMVVVADSDEADAADRIALQGGLGLLTPRQRTAVVLRYYADLSLADTAAAMGCAPGTVKALTSTGIGRLRDVLTGLTLPALEEELSA